jgi:3-hydroxyacyl-[acyl-carrier-protein] dehydratase
MLDFYDEITTFLPHREPFLFIDEIKSIDIGKSIHCVKHNSPEEDYFRGHFP